MANVFPENMDRLNIKDVPGSLELLESYIRYMRERVEFAVTGVTRTAAKAGNVGTEVVQQVLDLKSDMSVLSSQVNRMQGTVNANTAAVSQLQTQIKALQPLTGETPPLATTEGHVGQLYIETAADGAKAYVCTAADSEQKQYAWLCLNETATQTQ